MNSQNGPAQVSHVPAPPTGRLITTGSDLTQAATDLGNLAYAMPGAVTVPTSTDEIAAVLDWCRTYNVDWRARGTRHTMHGQGLPAAGGLQIDMRSLRTVHNVSLRDGIVADAGATVRDITVLAAAHGLRMAAGPTGYTRLTIGGVCSAGGISNRPDSGAIIDTVRAARVVAPDGSRQWCTRTDNSELFHSVLGGFGTAGVITQVVLDAAPAAPHVRTWQLTYTPDTLPDMLADMRTLARRGEADEVYALFHKPDLHTYRLTVSTYFRDHPPQARDLLHGLSHRIPEDAEHIDTDLLDHFLTIDAIYDAVEGWEHSTKVWGDFFTPDRSIDRFARELLGSITERDFSNTSFGVIFVKRRAAFSTGQLTMPAPDTPGDSREVVWLVDLLKDNHGLDHDRDWVPDMLSRHQQYLTLAADCDATVYRIGTQASR